MDTRTQPRRLSLGTQALLGLLAGIAAGAATPGTWRPAWVLTLTDTAGSLWINAILMTILPLVVSKVVVSMAARGSESQSGRTGLRASVWFVALLTASAACAAMVVPPVFSAMPVDPATVTAVRDAARVAAPAAPPSAVQVLLGYVPPNVFRAAAEGAIVPVLVFALVFGAALARIDSVPRETLLNVFRGIDAAVTIILSWVVTLAPAGVFALGFSLAARSGGGIVAALAYYVTVSSLTMVAGTAVLYAVVFLATGTSPVRFAKAAAQAQTVAFGTHSSLASLPAMIEGSETLGLSPTARNLVLPMALALFKYSGPMWFIVIVHFMSALSGTPVDATRTASVVFTAVVTSFAIGGVPSGAAFVAAPVLTAAGLPLAGLGIILAVDPIPNAFRTVANVTGMLALATLANGKTPRNPPGSGPTAPRPAATP